jgi:hypothetical protein
MWRDAGRVPGVLLLLLALATVLRVAVACGAPPSWLTAAVLAAAAGLGASRLAGRLRTGPALLLLLALYWLPHVYPRAGGDGLQSLALARSLLLDFDLSLENDYAGLGAEPVRAADGRAVSAMPVGTALLWLPALAVAHAGVLAAAGLGADVAADGFGPVYAATAMVFTFALGIAALLALEAWLRPRFGEAVAFLAAAGVWLATPLHYYLVVNPSMTHAPSAIAAVALFLAWMRARARPAGSPEARRAWPVVGLLAGATMLMRPQDAVLLLLPVGDLLLCSSPRWRSALRVIAPAAGVALVQLLVWAHFHGSGFVAAVSEGSFVGRTSPQPLHVLFSARHGLVTWTPAAGLALLGLLAALGREARVAALALACVAASAVVNGAMQDWWGSDSFGQRRLLGLLPVFALGLAHALDLTRRRPLLLPAALVAALAAWNVSFTGIFNARVLGPRGEAVSLDELVPAQLDVLTRHVLAAEAWLPQRAFFYLYDNLKGIYVDEGPRSLGGILDLGGEPQEPPLLGEGWAEQPQGDGERSWRRARGARSLLRVPVRTPGSFEVRIEARAVGPGLRLLVRAGGRELFEGPLGEAWGDIAFTLPAGALRPGLNDVALEWGPEPARGPAADVDRVVFTRPRLGRKGG